VIDRHPRRSVCLAEETRETLWRRLIGATTRAPA
jgi:hypothetical protein